MKEILRKLVETRGGPGDEGRVREEIKEEIGEYVDEFEVDNLGNLIVRKGSGDKNLMLAAHMDQIALSVRKIDDNGFIHVKKIWGIYPRELVNQRVVINTSKSDEELEGVIGTKPVHFFGSDEDVESQEMKDIVVDIGAESREEVEDLGVRTGDYIYFDRGFEELENDYVTGPALDDRIGCAVLIEALKEFDEDYQLTAVFTVQEEVGCKGAETSAYKVDPDIGLTVDVTAATDIPFIEEDYKYDAELGEGFGIRLIEAQGRRLITPENVKNWLLETAEGESFSFSRSVGGGGESYKLNLSREGVPTGALSIPIRNMHSPVEVAKMSDIEETKDFVVSAFQTLEEYF